MEKSESKKATPFLLLVPLAGIADAKFVWPRHPKVRARTDSVTGILINLTGLYYFALGILMGVIIS